MADCGLSSIFGATGSLCPRHCGHCPSCTVPAAADTVPTAMDTVPPVLSPLYCPRCCGHCPSCTIPALGNIRTTLSFLSEEPASDLEHYPFPSSTWSFVASWGRAGVFSSTDAPFSVPLLPGALGLAHSSSPQLYVDDSMCMSLTQAFFLSCVPIYLLV